MYLHIDSDSLIINSTNEKICVYWFIMNSSEEK